MVNLIFTKGQNIKSSLIVTGTHLSKNHGYTIDAIKKDGLEINIKLILKLKTDEKNLANAMAISLNKTTQALSKLKPDIVILLGDRYELLSSAISCMILNIPIGHIHGGELTRQLLMTQLGILLQRCLICTSSQIIFIKKGSCNSVKIRKIFLTLEG